MTAGEPAIVTSGLTKRFGDVVAVDGLSLRVERGEIYGFLGLNGAGKSTTIRMLLGMVRPTAGAAEVLGTPVRTGARAVWSRTGYLVEAASAYPELTVRENLEVARRLRRVPDPRGVDLAIERLGLGPYADRKAGALSSGNAQRLGLAKSLMHDPELLIIDEPTSSLDPAGVVEVREMLRSLASERGVTVFMSSHILGEVARLATRIGVIHEGRLLEELDASDLDRQRLVVDARDRGAARSTLIAAGFPVAAGGGDAALKLADRRAVERPDEVATLLVEAGAPPTVLRVEQEDLETHFLRLVGAGGGGTR